MSKPLLPAHHLSDKDAATIYVRTYMLHEYLDMFVESVLHEKTFTPYALGFHARAAEHLTESLNQWCRWCRVQHAGLQELENTYDAVYKASYALGIGAVVIGQTTPENHNNPPAHQKAERSRTALMEALPLLREAQRETRQLLNTLKWSYPDLEIPIHGLDSLPALYDERNPGLFHKRLTVFQDQLRMGNETGDILHSANETVLYFSDLSFRQSQPGSNLMNWRRVMLKAFEKAEWGAAAETPCLTELYARFETLFGNTSQGNMHALCSNAAADYRERDITALQREHALDRPDTDATVKYARGSPTPLRKGPAE